MKLRGIVVFLCLLVIGLFLPLAGHAQFTFTTDTGAFVITGYTGPGGSVTIPGSSNGLPVIVGDFAFSDQGTLTNLTIMSGVVNIGNNAFSDCVNLTGVTIPGSVTNIGNYAFNSCPSLTNLVISNGVANISEGAFQQAAIGGITIPGSVTNIGPAAFEGCHMLTSLTISNGLKNIGKNAFFDCYLVPSVNIPGSVATIGAGPFEACTAMTNIAVDLLNTNYASVAGVLFDKTLTTLLEYPCGGNGDLGYVIPGGVTSIGDSAFALSAQLSSIAIPSGVTNIGDAAFSFCYGLTDINADPLNSKYASAAGVLYDKPVGRLIQYPPGRFGTFVIPDTVTTIASGACQLCGITGVTIPNSVTNIEGFAFAYCWWLHDVTIPGSVRSIGSNVFYDCNYLTNVTLLDGVMNVENWAFGVCFNLNTVTLPASVQTIGVDAFSECYGLMNVYCLGHPPAVVTNLISSGNYSVFSWDPGTVYYLPGTTGWTNTFGGIPTAVWKPMVQTDSASLGVNTNQFGFNITWASGQTVVVDACTNFSNPVWQPVQTNTLVGNSAYFNDPQWTNYPSRFYRLRSP